MSRSFPLPIWSPANGQPLASAVLRASPADFRVDEILPFELDGTGDHVWLRLEKIGMNTEFLAKALAKFAGVKNLDVGYAGMKDRHAVTSQWFSVGLQGKLEADWTQLTAQFNPGEVRVLDVIRHGRKLKTGALKENRFELRLSSLSGDRSELEARLNNVASLGVPNYFGPQRFGRDGGNLAGAERLFGGATIRDHHERGLYLSAARSLLFNEVLAARVADGSWAQLLPGEAVMLDGAGSYFIAEADDAALPERLARFDIHPSGPLWGEGELPSRDVAQALESRVLAAHRPWCEALAALGLRQERRPLRLKPRELSWEFEENALIVRFALPSGCFATTVLAELVAYTEPAPVRKE